MPPQNIRILYLDILLMEFSWQEYWSNLPFPPPVENVSSELFTMTRLSRVALHSMAQRSWVTQALLPWQVCDPWRGLKLTHYKSIIPQQKQKKSIFSKKPYTNLLTRISLSLNSQNTVQHMAATKTYWVTVLQVTSNRTFLSTKWK